MEQTEIFILNRYAASELAGALLLGKMARSINDPYLRNRLTWHCAEEARHALVWESLISQLKIPSLSVHDSKKKSYFAYYDEVKDIVEFLAFVHVYELRVPFHFSIHKVWTSEQKVRDVLNRLIKEEDSHLSWIRDYLIKRINEDRQKVISALKKFSEIERRTYYEDLDILESMSPHGKSFVKLIKESMPKYKGVFDSGYFKEFG